MTKKILFIVEVFPSITQTFIVNQIVALIKKGHLVQIYSYQKGTDSKVHKVIIENNLLNLTTFHEEIPAGKKIRLLNFIRWIVSNFTKIDWNEFYKIIRQKDFFSTEKFLELFFESKWFLLRKNRSQILHAHFGPNAERIGYLKSKGILGYAKLISTFHGYDLSPHLMSTYLKTYENLFQESDLITVNTKYTESLLKDLTSSAKIEILPVGLDTAKFKKYIFNKNDDFRILFVGRLVEFKGPHVALEIINNLINRGFDKIKLLIVGEGELRNELLYLIKYYKIFDNVQLLGALPQEDIIRLMENCDLFLFPGIYDKNGRAENQGLVIQEAQAMEMPVVVSDVGGMKLGMIDGETGFVVKEMDLDAFADKIEYLINNEDKRIEMGKRGRAFVIENYDSKVLANKLVKDYKQLIRK